MRGNFRTCVLVGLLAASVIHVRAQQPVTVLVDAAADRHAISPLIYGVAYGSPQALQLLNATLNREGGNATSRYNWQTNASNHAMDWYFESLPQSGSGPGGMADKFVQDSKSGGAQPMLTVPINGWVAKLGSNKGRLASFSIAKYGPQTGSDSPSMPDAGNGVSTNGLNITNNDPTDANLAVEPSFQAGWIAHLASKWGTATNGGVRYYCMDNEWGLWHEAHRDVWKTGATMEQMRDRFCDYAAMIRDAAPGALILAPEEWGWSGYIYSGYDAQWAREHNWNGPYPDRTAHGNQDFMPWWLNQVRLRSEAAGRRLLDYFTLHYYPQGGEFGDNVSTAMQLRRNRSTRSLWDANYTDESWIASKVMLIPRMKAWVAANYPGTPIGLTEYNWGAENHINGATAQADVVGILGREGADMAVRWTTPATNTPTFKAMQIYRNYDGQKSTFGDVSVRASGPNPDNIAVFAAERTSDSALTVMVINKQLSNAVPLTLQVTNSPVGGVAQVWRLTSANVITNLPGVAVSGGALTNTLPAQSITLFVIPGQPRLAASVSASNTVNLSLSGLIGQTYLVQTSTNLTAWLPWSTNTTTANPSVLPAALATPSRFFRAKLAP